LGSSPIKVIKMDVVRGQSRPFGIRTTADSPGLGFLKRALTLVMKSTRSSLRGACSLRETVDELFSKVGP